MKEKMLIAGLGNPGDFYRDTRHNAGFRTVDRISEEYNIKIRKLKCKSLYGEGEINGVHVMLVKPQTYMNNSGESIRDFVEWFEIPLNNIIIVYDDADIPLGRIRVRPHGSSGSHNGMKSIIYCLESDRFPRVRIGIGKPPEGVDIVSHVLGAFKEDERIIIDRVIAVAARAAVCAAVEGVEAAMAKYNGSVIGEEDEILHRQTEGD
jgi:PTH1 family peptidyl-tRNA hydrolase